MALVKEVKRAGIESITVELTEREAQLVKVLTGFGTMHLTREGQDQLADASLGTSPYSVGSQVSAALTKALR